ncbi:MAG: PKD domain-containing protein [Deltaproteobacteria bacterium]|nr:PKD domain-containing protein [Deltaproteobacteria bacterium]
MWRNDSGLGPYFLILILLLACTSAASAFGPPQTADFTADPVGGPGPLTVRFTGSASEDNCLHEWDFGDGKRGTAPNPEHTYTRTGSYTVRHTVTCPGGTQTEIKQKLVQVTEFLNIVFGAVLEVFPDIWPSATSHDFGQIRPGSKAEWSFTLSNLSPQAYQVTGLSGLPENGFRLTQPPSMPLNLGAYESIEISVSFEPETSGLSAAILGIHTNAPFSPRIDVSLNGKVLNYHVNALGIADATFSSATAINNSGEVIGHSKSSTAGFGSFLWEPDTGLYTFSKELSGYGYPEDINNQGQIVGSVSGRGFIRTPNERTNLLAETSDSRTSCQGINDLGQVVGIVKSAGNSLLYGIFLCDARTAPPVLEEILPLQSEPIDNVKIGNSGMVIGTKLVGKFSEAFVWDAAHGMQPLGTLGGNYSAAANLNDLGNVVGSSTLQGDELLRQGFLWNRSKGMKPIVNIRKDVSSYPMAINNRNEIVGYLSHKTQRGETAFVYINGVTYSLGLAMAEGLRWSIERAVDINDHGQIVGLGTFKGKKRAFLMTPAPVTDLQELRKAQEEAPPAEGPTFRQHPALR